MDVWMDGLTLRVSSSTLFYKIKDIFSKIIKKSYRNLHGKYFEYGCIFFAVIIINNNLIVKNHFLVANSKKS